MIYCTLLSELMVHVGRVASLPALEAPGVEICLDHVCHWTRDRRNKQISKAWTVWLLDSN
jgi:hypothetical protein